MIRIVTFEGISFISNVFWDTETSFFFIFFFSVSWIHVIFNEVSPRVDQPSGWKSLAITVGEDGWSLWWHEHRPVRRLLRAQLLEFSWVGLFKGHPQVSLLRKMHTSTGALESRSHLMRNVSRFCNKNLSVLQGYWVFQLVLLFLFRFLWISSLQEFCQLKFLKMVRVVVSPWYLLSLADGSTPVAYVQQNRNEYCW